MKTYIRLVTAIIVLGFAVLTYAQQCSSPVSSWLESYNLSGSGTGSCGTSTCTTNDSVTVNNAIGFPITCNEWAESTNLAAYSANDEIVQPCLGGTETSTYVGTGGGESPYSEAILTLDPSAGTFTFLATPEGMVLDSWSGTCGSGSKKTLWPLMPSSNWPQVFNLPSAYVQPLVEENYGFQAGGDGSSPIPWSLSFTFLPVYDCKECREDGAKWTDPPVSSSIAPENSSLGEDLPVVGTSFKLHYESGRAPGAGKNGVAMADASALGGWTINVHHAYDPSTNTLFFGDGTQRSGYELGTPVSFNGNYLLTSEDGSEIYVFSQTSGAHLQTLRPMSGAVLYQFGYDAVGKLTTITDNAGNITNIQRNSTEQPVAIVSPYGQTTSLTVDSGHFLSNVKDPLGTSSSFQNSSSGLLVSRSDANGNTFNYTYDSNGKLIKDADSLGGYVSLAQTNASSGFGWTVAQTTSMGRSSSFGTTMALPWNQNGTSPVSEQHTNVWPNGLTATSTRSLNNGQLSDSSTLPDGTSDSSTSGPDPRWGLQVPVVTSETMNLGTLSMSITGSRTATLGTAGNPFSLVSETDTQTINGRTYTSTFTGSTLTWVNTSPVGRTLTVGLDSLERIASTQLEGLTATVFAYDSHGRMSSMTQGARQTTFSYGADGFLSSVTDPLKQTTTFAYDGDGNLLTATLPDGRMVAYTYDANGNVTSVTPPGESAHDFAYDAVNQATTYTPPTVIGTGATTYAYDLDRNMTSLTRPDGKKATFGYDSAGRLDSIGTPTGTTTLTYNPTTGNLATASRPSEHTAYSYDGPLLTKASWSGIVAGSVSKNYNDNFWVTSVSVSGGSNITMRYDNDGLLSAAGSMSLSRSPKNGLITGVKLGITSDNRTYNSFGELTGYTASVNGSAMYSVKYTRDTDGRVSSKTETINGASNTYSYTYDLAGRLTTAVKNTARDSYTYDTNSNRLSGTTSSGTSSGSYDAQDRLLTYGNSSFTYTANGELATETTSNQQTTYTYDVLGNLTAATLPNGTRLAYIIDGENRRVGKQSNGALQAGFLYDGDRIVAQLNGSNQLTSQFVYASGSNTPDYMITGGTAYRIFSDQVGSPVLIVNSSTGAIVEQITYDEFGNVLSDTNPGFQPFGFSGGLYDEDLKLVRFGARDYHSAVGRWTAKDPTLFAGGDSNLYGYVLADPVNGTDPEGLGGLKDFAFGFLDEDYNLVAPIVLGPAVSAAVLIASGQNLGGSVGLGLRDLFGVASDVDTSSGAYITGYFVAQALVIIATAGLDAPESGGRQISDAAYERGVKDGRKIGPCPKGMYKGVKGMNKNIMVRRQ